MAGDARLPPWCTFHVSAMAVAMTDTRTTWNLTSAGAPASVNSQRPRARDTRTRQAVTLIEVLAGLCLLGIMAMAAASQLRTGAVGAAHAKVAASRLAVELRRCRRLSINTGEAHRLAFSTEGGRVSGYQIEKGVKRLGAVIPISIHVAVGSALDIQFDALGAASNDGGIIFKPKAGSKRSQQWKVTVAQATGAVYVELN